MKAIITSYRRGLHRQNTRQVIVEVEGIDSKEKAVKLVGKKIVWKTPTGKEIVGEVRAPHGNKGMVRVLFEKGLPGQAIGTKVEVK
ncbi:50S ribosomal protein L35ae [Candidatus Woesearchaeota archaeon]|nr:50S ribosomal protein L35ae [Candidatus Woesearchaeota archaeon]